LKKIKVVLDSNVWLSGIYRPNGPNGAILTLAQHRKIFPITSPWIMAEVSKNLYKFKLSSCDHIASVQLVKPDLVEISQEEVAQIEKVPCKDRHVIAVAIKSKADLIITSDTRHLVENPEALKHMKTILNPENFLIWFKNFVQKEK